MSKFSSLTFPYALINLKTILNVDEIIPIYYAHMESSMRYAMYLQGNSTISFDASLAQKRVLWCIAGVNDTYFCKPLFAKCKALPLACLYFFKNISNFISKVIHNKNMRALFEI